MVEFKGLKSDGNGMRMWRRCLLFVLSLALAPTLVEAKDLYVNNSGSPACSDATSYASNSSSAPWCSLLRATWGNTARTGDSTPSQAAQAGDTVYVTAGRYQTTSFRSRFPVYLPANSGAPGAYITFQAVGEVRLTTTDAPAACPMNTGSPILGAANGSEYIKWDGFTIDQNEINFFYGNGMVQVWANHVTVSNNVLIGRHIDRSICGLLGDQHNGILAQGAEDGPDLRGLVITNNEISGFTGAGDNSTAITLYWIGDALIENNELHDNGSGVHAKSSNGDSTSVVVRRNLIYNNTANGIDVQSHSNWYVYQNVIRDNDVGFMFFPTQYQNNMDKPKDIYVVNNTFDGNTRTIYWKSDQWINNCHVKNNILTNGGYAVYGESVTPDTMTTSRVHFDYNWYDGIASFGVWWESNHFGFDAWRGSDFGGGGQDANSRSADPSYVNPAWDDFTLSSGSPARDAAIDILDLDGDGSTTDLVNAGAYLTGDEVIGLGGPRPRAPTDNVAVPSS